MTFDIERLQEQLPQRLPKMVVFDLDYTCWENWIDCTVGPPYIYNAEENVVYDRGREQLRLFRHIPSIFALIKTALPDTKIGIASRTYTPEWAVTAMKLLRIPELGGVTMHSQIDHFEIYPSSKIKHFRALEEKTGIPCDEMVFFDDEWRNAEVKKLGVHFSYVEKQQGVTMEQFLNALRQFDKESRYTQTKLDFGQKKLSKQ
ncbi:magnesium-dependent phosphatase-1 [Fennellomyces sp. T-0311]|nr:magnesium-dependent phosphatase-1 [Fennellomyces sp. T-0311]